MRCHKCDDNVAKKRWALGYRLCLDCGDEVSKKRRHCIVPMAKSNYVVVTDRTLLKGLNKYANTE